MLCLPADSVDRLMWPATKCVLALIQNQTITRNVQAQHARQSLSQGVKGGSMSVPGLCSTGSQSGSIRSCRALPPVRLTWIPTTALLAGWRCQPAYAASAWHASCLLLVSRCHMYAGSALALPGTRIIPCMACKHDCRCLDSLCISLLAQALRLQDWQRVGPLWRWALTMQ